MSSTKNVRGFSEISTKYIPIADFYADQSVFITGGSGFLGKVLIEKLLRSCPKIKNIYVLIRAKKGVDPASRINEIVNFSIFDELRNTNPSSLNKIIPIKGDITEHKLGLSENDESILIKSVSVVIHSAATVRFDEAMRKAVKINMLGTKMIIELCHRMVNLKALVHVSTAYSNCDRKIIDEVIYEPPIEPQKLINLMDCLDDEILDEITPTLIGKRPNTYTLTKALAENIIVDECGGLPVCIVRPSVVISSQKEPIKGWLDNYNGPSGIIIGMGYGCLRSFHTDNVVIDLIPVDKVTNLIIAAAWKTGVSRTNDVKIYCSSTGEHTPITIPKFVEICSKYFVKYPYSDAVWWPHCKTQTNSLIYTVENLLYHKLPVYLSEIFSKIARKPSRLGKIHNKITHGIKVLHYFTFTDWIFKSDNAIKLYNNLSAEDKVNFDFDVNNIQWDNYLEDYNKGIRQFILKQNPATLPESRIRIKRFYKFHSLLEILNLILFFRFVLFFVKDYKISTGVTVMSLILRHMFLY